MLVPSDTDITAGDFWRLEERESDGAVLCRVVIELQFYEDRGNR